MIIDLSSFYKHDHCLLHQCHQSLITSSNQIIACLIASSWFTLIMEYDYHKKITIKYDYHKKIIIKYDYHKKIIIKCSVLNLHHWNFLQNSNISCKGYRPREPRWYLTSFDPTRRLHDRFWRIRPTSRKKSNRFVDSTMRKPQTMIFVLYCLVLFGIWEISAGFFANNHPLRIQVCPKKGINPTILLWGWDWDHQTYSIGKGMDP